VDHAIAQARRQWQTSGSKENKVSLLTALHRAGRQDIFEKLTSLWDEEAIFVQWGLDLAELEAASDHIDAICQCSDCITVDQLRRRLAKITLTGTVSLWYGFMRTCKDIISANLPKYTADFFKYCRDPLTLRTAENNVTWGKYHLMDILVQVIQFDGHLRRQAAQQLVKNILETAT